jgi:hypothetical protein
MPKAWNAFTVHRDGRPSITFDPNTWKIVRKHGLATIVEADGHEIDTRPIPAKPMRR